jgi:ATP-binding cassette subfamily G (WHITE) protein 2 (PDR)
VTIAEATLSGAPLQCWDNSTRGLDSANAVQFCKTLRTSAEFFGTTSVVAIYQAPQSAYDQFDKVRLKPDQSDVVDKQVSLLYEGEQIYFGRTTEAKSYFVNMGFECPPQQTTPDFLTSLTSASERTPRSGFENQVPRTPLEFASAWKSSPEYRQLQIEIKTFGEKYPFKGKHFDEFLESRKREKSKHLLVFLIPRDEYWLMNRSSKSPYTLSFTGQTKLCLKRGFWRLKAEPTLTLTQLGGNFIMSLVIGSVFVNLGMWPSLKNVPLTNRGHDGKFQIKRSSIVLWYIDQWLWSRARG